MEAMIELKVRLKHAGKKENKITTAKLIFRERPKTVKELITYTVTATYNDFYKKTHQVETFEKGNLSQAVIYTEEELENKASSGKIDFGFLKSDKQVSLEDAIDMALLAFEDGLVAVFIDERRYEDADEKLELTDGETYHGISSK